MTEPASNSRFDVVIVGGGIMGSATAYSLLKADGQLKVAVVEMDPTYTRSSTTLSMSNARIQFSLKQNIQISQYAFKVLERFAEEMTAGQHVPNVAFRREGNLFIVAAEQRREAREALTLQQSLGCRVEWWDAERIRQTYPLFAPGAMAGTFGAGDGHFDAYAALMGYRAKSRAMGARYIHGEAAAIEAGGGRVQGVRLKSGERYPSAVVVNCAGAWAAGVARTAGVELPVVPVKRQVFVLDTAVKPAGPLPLTVLPSGLYFRSDTGGVILLGKSLPDDPTGFNFTWDDKRFLDILWPELAAFVPAFERAKLLRGWAGLYAVNTLDGNAILGQWPEISGFFLANGFSGHGLQQGPAVGRYLAELITGRKPVLDLSIFSPQRILEGRPISESGIV
jgi:glycine/D-amino acid oxidase-like deaminating enzyme